jgi:ABC-type dipeptide/oligopeptide/nickel transport system permease subunit
MLANGRSFLLQAPWISTFPGLAIMIVVLAANIFGDGLRDALDPRNTERVR